MSEPEAGSAVTELKTSARLQGGEVVINGSKVFSTHSPEAELFLIYARSVPALAASAPCSLSAALLDSLRS